jgi:hypothetical protein
MAPLGVEHLIVDALLLRERLIAEADLALQGRYFRRIFLVERLARQRDLLLLGDLVQLRLLGVEREFLLQPVLDRLDLLRDRQLRRADRVVVGGVVARRIAAAACLWAAASEFSSEAVALSAASKACRRAGVNAWPIEAPSAANWLLRSLKGAERLASASLASATPETRSPVDAVKVTAMAASVIEGLLCAAKKWIPVFRERARFREPGVVESRRSRGQRRVHFGDRRLPPAAHCAPAGDISAPRRAANARADWRAIPRQARGSAAR